MLLRRTAYYFSSIFTLLTGFKNPIQIIRLFLGADLKDEVIVTLKQSGLQFHVRGKMDVWSLKETFLDRFYQRYGFELQDGWKIVDIGGGIGDYSLFAAFNRPQARILVFEPFADSYHILQRNIDLNQITNVEIFAQAVGSQDGRLKFISPSNDPLSIQTTSSESTAPDTMTVSSVSLASILADPANPQIDLLKLDCEGAEYDILMNSDPAIFERIDRIVMEYHDQITPYNHTDLASFLRKHGYRVELWQNAAHDTIGYLRATRVPEH